MKRYAAGLFASVLCLIHAPDVLGCVCDGTPTVEGELQKASAVFSGKFVAAEYRKGIVSELMQFSMSGEKDYEVLVLRFQIENYWKGNSADEIILVTDQTKTSDGSEIISDCDYPFEVGKRYLVFAFGNADKLSTSACTRTQELSKAKKELKTLGKGRKPAAL